jgi:hypothetical protein
MRKNLKRIAIGAGLLILALIVGCGLYIYIFTHTSSVNFKEYEPTHLPAGLNIKNRNLEIWDETRSGDQSFPHWNKVLRLDVNQNISIGEWRYSPQDSINFSCNGPENNVEGSTCSTQTSPKGQKYTFTVFSYGNSSQKGQDIWLVKGNTSIHISNLETDKIYPSVEWGEVIDSLRQVHYKSLEITHFSPGP